MIYLCIIPVRAESKGIAAKNVRPLREKPLMAWTIEQACACGALDRIVVSTESPEYQAIARRYGAEAPFRRPDSLAADETASEPVLVHALDDLAATGYEADAVVMLQVTSPFRRVGTIERAIAQFEREGADSLFSAVPDTPLLWRNAADPEPLYDFHNRPRRQDIPPEQHVFRENGSIFISRVELLRKTGNRLGGKKVLFPMEGAEGLDVDTLDDFALAEAYIAAGLFP
jgi:CMP-N,N'-diacetyllegionaminic acid synthase